MATTIQSGRASSPLLTADVASRAEVYGGRGLVFDGVLDALDIVKNFASAFSISFWIKPHDVTDSAVGVIGISPQDSNYIRQGSQSLYIRIANKGSTYSTGNVLSNNVWTFLTITRDDSNVLKWYVDGAYIGSSATQSGTFEIEHIGKSATHHFDGALSDLKFYSSALTEAEVQSQYLKPESVPSPSTLVAWYPMCESNPESPQSIVYDHSEKGLGGDFARAVVAGSWTAYANMTVNSITGGVSIVAPTTASGDSVSGNGAYIYFRGATFFGENQLTTKDLEIGKTYSVTFNAFYSGGASGVYVDIYNSSSSVFSDALTTTNTSYTMLFEAQNETTGLVRFQQMKLDNTVYITDISVKKVRMGNHATTNFFEPNLSSVLTSTQKTSFGDLLTSDDSSFDFTNGTVPVEGIVLGSELMNYDFSDGTGVTVPSSLSSLTTFDGEMVINGGSVSSDYYTIADSTTWDVNKIYKIVVVCSAYTSGSISHQGGSASFGINFGVTTGETGTFTYYAVPSKDSSIGLRSQSFVGTISSISIKEATTPKFFPLVGSTEVTGHALKLINDGTNMGHIVLPITTVIGYQYYAELKVLTANMSGGLSISDDLEENTLTVTSTSGEVIKTANFTASRTISYIHIKNNATNSNQYNLYDNLSTYLVGVSSTGLTTAQNEPVIPQVPLMKYNQKIFFSGNNGSGAEVLWNNIGGAFASSEFTLSVVHLSRDSDDIYAIFDITESPYTDYLRLFRDASGRYYVYIENANDTKTIYQYSSYTDNADFNHIVLTCDGSKWCFYINGYKEREESNTHTTEHLTSATTDMRLGMDGTDSETYRAVGIIDELSLWNTALTYDEVKELFADSAVKDATTHSKSGNLLGYWRNDGVTTWQDRKKEQWMMLNGTNTEIELSTSTQSSSIRTAIAWVYTDSSSLMSIFSGSNANIDNDLTSGFTRWYTGTSGWLQGTIDVRGAWTMVTYQFEPNGSNMDFKTYVNDTLDINLTLTSNYNNGTIRRLGYKSGQSRFFDGVIAQAGSVASALTQAQITEIFNLGRKGNWITTGHDWEFYYNGSNYATGTDGIEDASTSTTRDATITNGGISGGNDGSVQGTPDSITIREGLNSNKDGLGFPLTNPSSNVLRLNGSSEIAIIPKTSGLDMSGGKPFTMSCWFKARVVGVNHVLISSGDADTAHYENSFYVSSSNKLAWNNQDSDADFANSSGTTLAINTWYFATITFNGSTTVKIYLNDALDGTKSDCTNVAIAYTDVYIGKRSNGLFFNGLIDEARIYNRELLLPEIQKNYKHQKGKHK